MPSELNIGIVGCGAWGINHVRTAVQLLGANRVVVCDSDPAAVEKVRGLAPGIRMVSRFSDLTADPKLSGIIVATPAETHFELTRQALEAGKHVLVEKPMTLVSDETRTLIRLAEKQKRKLMVGHVLLYHPAVVTMKRMIDDGTIGKLQYIYSNRLNLGAIRSEENSLWSFAPHDISVVQYLIGGYPATIDAKGSAFVQESIEDSTLTYLVYPENIHVHIFVSWLHPFKEQRMVVIGDRGMLVFEDSSKDEKLRFYRKGFARANGKIEKFDAPYEVVKFEPKMPLNEEHLHFYNSIETGQDPLTDGHHALQVLEILEQAQLKLKGEYAR